MSTNKYCYLFPFEKITPGSKILIYGAGLVGQEYLRQIEITKYCTVVGFLDRKQPIGISLKVPVYNPEIVQTIDYDYVVLAVNNNTYCNDMCETLWKLGTEREKIVHVGLRADVDIIMPKTENGALKEHSFAFTRNKISIALKYPSSLGDCIQRKALYIELSKVFQNCLIDIYATNTTFIRSIYSDQNNINEIIDDGGALYYKNASKYLMALEVRYTLLLNSLNFDLAKELGEEYEKKLRIIKDCSEKYDLPLVPLTQNRIQCERAIFKGWNCYSFYNYISLFNIKSSVVSIPMSDEYKSIFEEMNLSSYITLNYGNSSTSKGNKNINSRQWPKEHLLKFIKLFKLRFPTIKIVQVGDSNAEELMGVDTYVLGKNIELVKYVLKGALLHLDSEGGLTHLATQIGTKCVVLFGPTQEELFGYRQNINIKTNKCLGCYCLYNQPFMCARGMEKPECMYSISPELVMDRVMEYMQKIGKDGK